LSLYPSDPSEPIVSAKGLVYKCKKDLPLEKALVVIVFGKPKILRHIGPGLDFLDEDGFLQNHFDEEVEVQIPSDGLYLWTGQVVERTTCDNEVEFWIDGSFEPASRSQWHKYLEGTPPWNVDHWFVDPFVRDSVLGSCEIDHTKSRYWPPDRFHREDVI
jgi:hypothetical protein